jgi:hypothetical protein
LIVVAAGSYYLEATPTDQIHHYILDLKEELILINYLV